MTQVVLLLALQASDDGVPPTWRLLQSIAEAKGFRADFDAVPARLAQMVKSYDLSLGSTRLQRVMQGLAQPWTVPAIARELRDALAASVDPKAKGDAAKGGVAALVGRAADFLDCQLAAAIDDPKFAELDALWQTMAPLANEDLLDALSQYVAVCHDLARDVTGRMTDEEQALLRGRFPDWCEAWYRSHFPKVEITLEQAALLEKWKALHRKVDRPRLLAVAPRVARLADPAFLATLGKRVAKTVRSGAKVDGFSGDVIATAGVSDESRVVLLGAGKTTVSGRAALVIDLGGDDTWRRAAVIDDASALVSVVIELNGNDVYSSESPGPAYAAGGIALLVDVKGKERYTSGRLGQGASAYGFAALVDLEGDDRYEAHDYVQGFTFAGGAFLIDRGGDDVYQAWAYAQGAGCGNGFSACIDGGGSDRYVANGQWPDVYGDSGPESFHGASQGYCTGFRSSRSEGPAEIELAGGIAALVDLGDGKDYYESGNFSQGGGYYFGFGLMYDGGGDDLNHGYRYSQGFGVHQACGIRWDAGGDDVYSTKCAANCGAGWDEGVGWLIDESGDDRYDVGGLALGGTANSAVAVLVDGGGSDRYGGGGGNDSQGGSSDSSYHQFQAIGALIDLGGGKDSYTRNQREDDCAMTGDWFGLFVDAKEKEASKLLDPKAIQKLLAAARETKQGAEK